MKRKMTRLARGRNRGGFGASGFAAASAFSPSNPARASEPKPQANCWSAWRRGIATELFIAELVSRHPQTNKPHRDRAGTAGTAGTAGILPASSPQKKRRQDAGAPSGLFQARAAERPILGQS